ncbi:histidine phosphatase family protein [Lacticaseibacillus manihotivorans]|uniref:histidine phosphatase family protein n=1 Tax=Lacticaseibacillus manihotivorans TaxID=88233 RepID=UPI000ACEF8B1|nr:histidine phosphatase family protein [Lacticaseibacillus manihotivorans]
MTIQLYLVRHGETPMNQNNQLQGITDMPLTPKGRQQAQATAALLAGVPFSAAYSSDRLRAVDTAEIILAEHPSVVLHRRAGLREYYFGGLEGVTNNQLISASLARYGVKTMTHAWTRGERFAQLIRNFEKKWIIPNKLNHYLNCGCACKPVLPKSLRLSLMMPKC